MGTQRSVIAAASDPSPPQRIRSPEVEAVLTACRLLVAISVKSLSAVEDLVTLTQLRILVVIASRGVSTLSDLAGATGLHMSTASRACEQLVGAELLARTDDPEDRRSLRLSLTDQGVRILASVAKARRASIAPTLRRMAPARRGELIELLEEFTTAGGEPPEAELWAMGWPT